MVQYKEPVKDAPCKTACPAGIDVPRYVRLVAEGKFDEALAVVCERIPFPVVCGRVCFHPCEIECNGNYLDGAIAICPLKRFVAERPGAVVKGPPQATPTGKSVAVVGSGPAGLTAAYYLARLGYKVTVFEASAEPGGMMRFGIPDYRLPKDMLAVEINAIKNAGVNIKTNSKIESTAKLLEQGYAAVFVAIGAGKSTSMGIEGEDTPVVKNALSLMQDLNVGKKVSLGNRVVVVGGGSAAIDAARCALRLGSEEVTILYRRSRDEMPASPIEIDEALAEGVKIQFLAAPTKITMDDGRAKINCVQMKLGKRDASGRRQATPVPGSGFTVEADTVISAVGQAPDLPAGFGLATAEGNVIKAAPDTLATNRKGVFAGGDAVNGPSSVIEAIAAGRKAASAIDKYLGGKGGIDVTLASPEAQPVQTELQGVPVGGRTQMPALPVDERLKGFSPIELGFNEGLSATEAKRCLRCNLPITIDAENCTACFTCIMRCSLRFGKNFSPSEAKLRVIPITGKINEIIFTDECDTCGICARYCPHDALYRGEKRPAEVKPKQ